MRPQVEFYLYRVQLVWNYETPLYPEENPHDEDNRQSEIERFLSEAPLNRETRRGSWHLGDVETLGQTGFYFRMGRTTKATLDLYESGHFETVDFDAAPWTHCLLDSRLQVCAMAKKTRLSQTAIGLGRQLQRLLEHATQRSSPYTVRVDLIRDPVDFVSAIAKAHEIVKFGFTFGRSNAFDVTSLVKEVRKYVDHVHGSRGKTEVTGDNLSAEEIEPVTRAVASIGEDAYARLRPSRDRGS